MGYFSRLVTGILGLAILLYVYRRYSQKLTYDSAMRRYGCQPPKKYPHWDPIFGLDLFWTIKRNVDQGVYLRENQKRYETFGKTFQSNSFGTPIVNTIEPENLKTILATSFTKFGFAPLRRDLTLQLWGKGILSEDGEYWQHSRALIRPTFARTQVAALELFEKHVDRLIECIPRDGSTVDLQVLFKRYILDTSSEFLLGKSVDAQLPYRSEETDHFLEAFEYASVNMGKVRHLEKIMFLSRDTRWADATKTIHEFIDKHVARAQERQRVEGNLDETPHRFILLDEMVKLTDDALELRHQILHVFIPGHESTGVLLASAFYLLARHPDVWEKLRAEILSGPEKPTYESIKNSKYLQYVLNEVLRIETPFFAGSRICLSPTTLPLGGGPTGKSPLYIPRNQIIAFDIRALHRDKDTWGPDANDFRPERWEKARPGWEYIPFNGGPRTCLAQQLVLVEAGYVVTRLARVYKGVEKRDEGPWVEELKLSVRSRYGVKVGMVVA